VKIDAVGPELAAIASSGRADAADDALALLADAYFLQSAGVWTRGLGLLHFRAGFGVPDERPIPEELWGPDLSRAFTEGKAVLVLAGEVPPAWQQAERAHIVVPINDVSGTTRGALIATTDQLDIPEDLVEHAQGLAPLLPFTEGSPRRIADDLERDIGSSLWAGLLTVQDADDPRGKRAARALAAALADLRAMVLALRHGLAPVTSLAEAVVRFGEANGLDVEHDEFPGEDALPPTDRAALIAVIREALANAAVHGRARRARVQAGRTEDGVLMLIVEDDGIGIPADRVDKARTRGGLGLASIEGHALARGGTLTISRADMGGLRVEVALPAL
jgi:two-component sensor histidine kinase